ncbi:hypothetical protein [Streptomyces acidiscabies]|uniref:Uncharacterized protein n=1 Tax=Streptomyces acidiscabies TaxID=42234 RepID=A0A0L0JTE0_9ACTN|nr:hypothetical protein [Streptomyces acidiscabies]MBP5942482.1 hypothetical protein [Streptomyces sp. LBUM 1476]KND28744.1 hypothetical protein IQ63_33120 [Streptomyces acidiscabies]MBZ3917767.1 hypothetical protein [Streptomyces acidiscabies]MDX2961735.1 hypothetical protein [Streptomyces acidiscabies]MDX3023518.1 hypothetical protein [Streptomyces acidiscabies]
MIPLALIGATIVGACMVFGYSSFVVGFSLMAAGIVGLVAFIGTPGSVLRPGEREYVEERHYFGDHDDHREFRK